MNSYVYKVGARRRLGEAGGGTIGVESRSRRCDGLEGATGYSIVIRRWIVGSFFDSGTGSPMEACL